MAMRDEIKEQQRKLKDKSLKERLQYFWDYYKVHTLIVLLTILLAGIFIRDLASAKADAFSVTLVNAYGGAMQEGFQADFAAYAGIDTDKYDCRLDTSTALSLQVMSQLNLAVSQRIVAMAQGQQLDMLVGDAEVFGYYAQGQMFLDLREELSAQEYARYEKDFYYIDGAGLTALTEAAGTEEAAAPSQAGEKNPHPGDPSTMEDPIPVGIYLKNSSKLEEWGCYAGSKEPPILGFVYSTQRKELCHLFLKYLGGDYS